MAIAFDAVGTQQTVSGTSLTYSFTTSGSNRILHVAIWIDVTADQITGVTYNGVAMTRIGTGTTQFWRLYLYELVAPASGANNVVVSRSSSGEINSVAISHTGAKQTSQPDASNTASGNDSSPTVSVTTVADNSWPLGAIFNQAGGTYTPGSGITERFDGGGGFFGDRAISPPAATTIDATTSTSGTWAAVVASIAPFLDPPAAVTPALRSMLLG